jgi:hypothetical protein
MLLPLVALLGALGVKFWGLSHEAAGKKFLRQSISMAQLQVQSGKSDDITLKPRIIDLKQFMNTALAESPASPRGVQSDNLAELPQGTHLFGGVPFDVEGSVQLMGGIFKRYGKRYPTKIENIPIEQQCSKLHFFQGSIGVSLVDYGTTVATCVLHYADGTSGEVQFVAGEQAFDWWAFPLDSDHPVPPDLIRPGWEKYAKLPEPGTKLAWIGSNPWIHQWRPMFSLCLYRTTFSNPQPSKVISSLDYISSVTMAAPFLVGLTVERTD